MIKWKVKWGGGEQTFTDWVNCTAFMAYLLKTGYNEVTVSNA